MILNKKKSLLFIGDSITDCRRSRPIGTTADGLGAGYVNLINSFLQSSYPELQINILNTGISGDRITDLQTRWKEDVLDLNSNWVTIMIGINDVWRQFEFPENNDQVNIDMFRDIYIELLKSIINKVDGVILMAPFFIEDNLSDPMRKMMDEYGNVVKELSVKFNTLFVDTQESFDKYLKLNSSSSLADDKIHPNQVGHMIIAKSFLDVIDFK